MKTIDLEQLRLSNVARCEEVFHPLKSWTPTDWACAMAGEAGETCNAVKKLRRHADGTNTAKDPQSETELIAAIGDEIADTIIYADLLAARLGINLSEAIQRKFNVVSKRMNSSVTLALVFLVFLMAACATPQPPPPPEPFHVPPVEIGKL